MYDETNSSKHPENISKYTQKCTGQPNSWSWGAKSEYTNMFASVWQKSSTIFHPQSEQN